MTSDKFHAISIIHFLCSLASITVLKKENETGQGKERERYTQQLALISYREYVMPKHFIFDATEFTFMRLVRFLFQLSTFIIMSILTIDVCACVYILGYVKQKENIWVCSDDKSSSQSLFWEWSRERMKSEKLSRAEGRKEVMTFSSFSSCKLVFTGALRRKKKEIDIIQNSVNWECVSYVRHTSQNVKIIPKCEWKICKLPKWIKWMFVTLKFKMLRKRFSPHQKKLSSFLKFFESCFSSEISWFIFFGVCFWSFFIFL